MGGFNLPYAQEIVFIGSVSIIFFLMAKLMRELPESMRFTILGTAIIIFVFRAMPGPGPGLTWFEIDNLGFDEQFFSVLSLLASCTTNGVWVCLIFLDYGFFCSSFVVSRGRTIRI